MIYWYTGQPGHGKTLTAIARALDFKAQGRQVYVCNVRDFDYDKTGMLKMSPEDFRNWPEFLPDGAVCLVDEAYEHGMLPKRAAASKVPHHVERLATHRHKGLDFIFVCQSPDKQIDGFVHDLIERQIHVRRRFGTKFQHLREFDRFERNPEKATPLVIKRQRLPKHVFGLYKSTELDTTERRVPWYFVAFAVGGPLALGFMYYTFGGLTDRMGKLGPQPAVPVAVAGNGAKAPVAATAKAPMDAFDYINQFVPRVASQPWSAPAYDQMKPTGDAPRLFCMASGPGRKADGKHAADNCTCLTEQGTYYYVTAKVCRAVARNGQYEPLRQERDNAELDGYALQDQHARTIAQAQQGGAVSVAAPQVSGYGDIGVQPNPGGAATNPGFGTAP